MSLLDLPFLLETRRNHALEHATLKILSPKYPAVPMGGHSNPTGFMIIGDVHVDDLRDAADEALERLRAGESDLAIHSGCGTNYATSGLLAGSLAWFGMKGKGAWHKKLWRIPFILPLAVVVWELSKPLGPKLQAGVTTEPNVGRMEIISVQMIRPSLHRVITR
ncbi:MAG: hypothetical protein KAH06_01430 [Desulfobacterales bacterium]|nr:hypothetical protein [Desulfobacterales bacterium]